MIEQFKKEYKDIHDHLKEKFCIEFLFNNKNILTREEFFECCNLMLQQKEHEGALNPYC